MSPSSTSIVAPDKKLFMVELIQTTLTALQCTFLVAIELHLQSHIARKRGPCLWCLLNNIGFQRPHLKVGNDERTLELVLCWPRGAHDQCLFLLLPVSLHSNDKPLKMSPFRESFRELK